MTAAFVMQCTLLMQNTAEHETALQCKSFFLFFSAILIGPCSASALASWQISLFVYILSVLSTPLYRLSMSFLAYHDTYFPRQILPKLAIGAGWSLELCCWFCLKLLCLQKAYWLMQIFMTNAKWCHRPIITLMQS